MTESTGRTEPRRVLIIVENLPVPFDRRVWQEATTLRANGYDVSIICPIGKGYEARREDIDGIHIYRHPLPLEASGAAGYAIEYAAALFWETLLAWRVFFQRGFDIIHACNPPDTIFLVALPFKVLFRKRFIFDHHDLNPELYEAKFGRRDFFYRLLCTLERWTFRLADVVISTNNSYRDIALARGGKTSEDVIVVRSGPSLERLRRVDPDPALRRGRQFLVGYLGVMGRQEGIGYLLEAARIIVKEMKRTDIQFTLVGSGPELEILKKSTQEMGLGDFVEFTGRLPDDEMVKVLCTADVCVNPDEFNAMNDKSTMNKVMEYMALEKPIVQFDMKEGRFSARDASLYARPNDSEDMARKIVDLLEDPERRRRMGQFGRQRVETELAWPHEIPRLLRAYDKAATKASSSTLQAGASPREGGVGPRRS